MFVIIPRVGKNFHNLLHINTCGDRFHDTLEKNNLNLLTLFQRKIKSSFLFFHCLTSHYKFHTWTGKFQNDWNM